MYVIFILHVGAYERNRRVHRATRKPSGVGSELIRIHSRVSKFSLVCARRQYFEILEFDHGEIQFGLDVSPVDIIYDVSASRWFRKSLSRVCCEDVSFDRIIFSERRVSLRVCLQDWSRCSRLENGVVRAQ
jgi:hypothetical protein